MLKLGYRRNFSFRFNDGDKRVKNDEWLPFPMTSRNRLLTHNFIIDVGKLSYNNALTRMLRNCPGLAKFHLQCVVFACQCDEGELRYSPHPLQYLSYISVSEMDKFIGVIEKANSFVDHLSACAKYECLLDSDLTKEYKLMNDEMNDIAFKKLLYFSLFTSRLSLDEHAYKGFSVITTMGSKSNEEKFRQMVPDFRIMFHSTGCENMYHLCRMGSLPQNDEEIRMNIVSGRGIPVTEPQSVSFGRGVCVVCLAVRSSVVPRTHDSEKEPPSYMVRSPDATIRGILWPTGPGMVEVDTDLICRVIRVHIDYMNRIYSNTYR